MKKSLHIMLIALLAAGLVACSSSNTSKTSLFMPAMESKVVTFTDPTLEVMVRGAMGKPEGDITVAEVEEVTRLNLSFNMQRYISDLTPIKDISGLENFTNLESLDLSFHSITDISPLAGLTKLTSLSLSGNPVTEISPLARLTNLKVLILSNCAAQDYNPLANLINLEFLMLDNSAITDASPLLALTSLKYLYLANSPINDYAPLAEIYPNLEQKDFIVASTLAELGFCLDGVSHQASFDSENASFTIHHTAWGPPPEDWVTNIIRISMYVESGYKVLLGFYVDLDAYVFMMDKEGETPVNYVYDAPSGNFSFGAGDRVSTEQAIRAALDVMEGEDVLLTPVRVFNDMVKNTFGMTAEKLYSLPYEPPTLKNLSFVLDETTGNFVYEQHEGIYTNIQINRAEGIEKAFDVVFFQPLSDEYRVNVTYYMANKKFYVKADDNDQGGASYEYFIDTGEHIDEWCSDPDKTVEDYFIKAYNDPEIEDIYLHSVELMGQYISDTFGMTIEELYSLPTGE